MTTLLYPNMAQNLLTLRIQKKLVLYFLQLWVKLADRAPLVTIKPVTSRIRAVPITSRTVAAVLQKLSHSAACLHRVDDCSTVMTTLDPCLQQPKNKQLLVKLQTILNISRFLKNLKHNQYHHIVIINLVTDRNKSRFRWYSIR